MEGRSVVAGMNVGDLVTPTGVLLLDHSAPRDVWLDKRREGICSSDVPALLEVPQAEEEQKRYSTPLHIYYDKTGQIPHSDEPPSDAAYYGLLFEGPLAFDWAARNCTSVEEIGIIGHQVEAWQMCSLDRHVETCPLDRSKHWVCALEAKQRNAYVSKFWRKGPPDDVLAQVLWQILVTGFDHIHVVCLIGGNDYRQYVVRRSDHEKLVAYLDAEATRLWFEHIIPRVPPALTGDEPPDALLELYERLHPNRKGTVDFDRDLEAQDNVTEYLLAGADESEAKQRKKVAYAKMIAALGDAQGAYVHDKLFYEIATSERSTCDLRKLRELYPQVYDECVTDGTNDRLFIPKNVREEFIR